MTLAVDLAATHARAMPHRPWTANAFARLLDSAGVFLIGDARCFALGRVAADEAELLTLACDPDHRRQGLARAALTAFEGTGGSSGSLCLSDLAPLPFKNEAYDTVTPKASSKAKA